LITHAHNDHTVDLDSILTLVNKHNDAIKDLVIEEMKENTENEKREEIEKRLKEKGKKIDLFINVGTFMKYSGWLNLKDSHEIENVTVLMPNTTYELPHEYHGIKIYTTQAKHYEILDEKYAIGFILEIDKIKNCSKKIKVGFTGDTGWDWDRSEIMIKPFKDRKPSLMIAHLGSIKKKEFDYLKANCDEEKKDCFYTYHLGLLEMTKFLDETRPKLTVISEFGEELRDKRNLIAESISKVLGLHCLPGDIGLHIKLCDLNVHCFIKKDFIDYNSIDVVDRTEESKVYFCRKGLGHSEFIGALDKQNKEKREPPIPLAKRTRSFVSSNK
jgi:hypothetical protein